MNFSTRLPLLRLSFQSVYRLRPSTQSTPPLHTLLHIPIHERLILLAIIDGSSPIEIKRTLKATHADLRMETPRMMLAVAALTRELREPFDTWPRQYTRADLTPDEDITKSTYKVPVEASKGSYWDERWGREIERTLRQLLFAEVAVCLFGDGVPEQLRDLTLEERCVVYCSVVQEMKWREIQNLLGCTEWRIRAAIDKTTRGLEAI